MQPADVRLEDLWACFEGIIPASISTCARDGTPNVSFLSQVYYVDAQHVALSFQFFNRTRRNIEENPRACVQLIDPRDHQAYRLYLAHERSDREGPIFDAMSYQLDAIASHVGMAEVFKLRAADIYRVDRIEKLAGFTCVQPPELAPGTATLQVGQDLDRLRLVTERLQRADAMGEFLEEALHGLEVDLGFSNSMVLLADERERKLTTVGSRGYPENGAGSEVRFGEGLIGMAALARRSLQVSNLNHQLSYARAIREHARKLGKDFASGREIPLPGLPNARCQIAVPLQSRGRLIGVLAVEGVREHRFEAREQALLEILAPQLAAGFDDRGREVDENEGEEACPERIPAEIAQVPVSHRPALRKFCFFPVDDCVFVDGEYLIRNVPGRILWRLLTQNRDQGRSDFNNRELRMDAWIGLPSGKDNLEARLILLRKRLEQKCPDVRISSCGRGRFRLESDARIELEERR